VALKKIADKNQFYKEIKMLDLLRHPNIVLFIASCYDNNDYCIISEYLSLGSLHAVLKDFSIKLEFELRIKICKQIAISILFMHNRGIIHRDIKSLNILVDKNFTIKLADFGLAYPKEDDPNTINIIDGTVQWMAPELFENAVPNEKADVYSFGIVLWEIESRKSPFTKLSNTLSIIYAITHKDERPIIPEKCDKNLKDLMTKCWDPNPTNRPTFSEIVDRLTAIENEQATPRKRRQTVHEISHNKLSLES